jgi:hypothetical protein
MTKNNIKTAHGFAMDGKVLPVTSVKVTMPAIQPAKSSKSEPATQTATTPSTSSRVNQK